MTEQAAVLSPGAMVDSLRIEKVLGQGSFAVTYLVTDENLGRSFALKEYLPAGHIQRLDDLSIVAVSENLEFDFTAGLKRFLIEGRTVAPLEHPNIVKVFRCFEANGTAYLLMPWYKGEALHDLLKHSGNFGTEEIEALSTPMLDALAYIHQQGVVHQDIKPSNIYITQNGKPILLDFGSAAVMQANHTEAELKLGSEGYAAPELSVAGAPVGPWTDIYSFAATLYRCISGRVPPPSSQREHALANGLADPLELGNAATNGVVSTDMVSAIEKGLEINAEQRPRSIAEWSPHFKKNNDQKIRATPDVTRSGSQDDIEREGREWLPIILGSIFAIALAAVAIYLLFGSDPEPEIDSSTDGSTASATQPTEADGSTPKEKLRWEQALDADTIFAYRQFLEDFPISLFAEQATTQIEALDDRAWRDAAADGSKNAVESYLETFPEGLHEPEAMIRLDELKQADILAEKERVAKASQDDRDWKSAYSARTLKALQSYISKWPGGKHIEEAYDLKEQLESDLLDTQAYAAARKLNTIEAYRDYIKAFPQGSKLASALEAMDSLTLRPGKTFKDCDDCPTMIVIPSGSYWQGSDENSRLAVGKEKPQRKVSFAEPFAVGVFEITMAQWDQCKDEGACSESPRDNGWGRANRPVIMVSWNDAQEYVDWISKKTGQSYRLPSESEWEYVARAGERNDWPGGDPSRVCEHGNIAGSETDFRWQHDDCSDGAMAETLPVGSFKPNAFGVYDVIGNVAEWTLDCMNLSYLDAPADGSAWTRGMCSSRMTRGGSWFTGTREIRLPARFNLRAGDRNDFTGFRLVRTVEDQ